MPVMLPVTVRAVVVHVMTVRGINRHEMHAAFGTGTGIVAEHLRVHRARILRRGL